MTETPAEELIRQIYETDTPDKRRYARVRMLARQISQAIDEPKTAMALNSAFRGAYMDLQLALLRSTDSSLLDLYKQQCTKTVSKMCRAAYTSRRTGRHGTGAGEHLRQNGQSTQ